MTMWEIIEEMEIEEKDETVPEKLCGKKIDSCENCAFISVCNAYWWYMMGNW